MDKYKKYISDIIAISIPMIIGNLANIAIGTTDVMVASRHGTNTLAAISIANAIMASFFIVGIGLMAGITPVVSNYLGEKRKSKKFLLPTINYSFAISTIFTIIGLLTIPFIGKLGFDPVLVPMIKQYIFIVSFSNFGGYLHFALKEYLQAYEVVIFPNVVMILSIFVNLVLNIALVFGFWKIPALGAVGLAIATLASRFFAGGVLLVYCFKSIDFTYKWNKEYIKQTLKVAFPIAIALMLEFCSFNIITIIMGKISSLFAAAQSIIITITSITYMVPLAISNAIAIKVGFANGARDYTDIKRYSFVSCMFAFCFMACCAVLLFIFPKQILHLFTSDAALIKICVPILILAAIYQVFDGLQVAFSGILKGLKQTIFVTAAIIIGYWVVGIPLGALLAFKFNLEMMGFWIGLAFAIFTMCIFLGCVIAMQFKKLRVIYK